MPALTTHKIFADLVLEEIDQKLIDKNTYYMFAQSHDILYYYKGKDYKLYNKLGTNAHHKNTQQFILNTIQYIKKNKIKDKQCHSFLYGIITHYYLDSTLHPYIFYKSGIYKKNKETYKYRGQHSVFERTLDSVYYQRINNRSYKECDLKTEILPKVMINSELQKLINYSYSKTYEINNVSSKIIKGYNTMRLFHNFIVEDKHSVKYNIYKVIDKISKNKPHLLQSYSTSISINQNILNLKNKVWYHPATKEIHNESIPELIEIARRNATKTINKIIKSLKENQEIDYKKLIKNIDYSTGLLIKDNKKMKHFEY